MAFDGITVAALTWELSNTLTDGRITRIIQPEPDELLLTIKTQSGQEKLYLSASASLPLIYLTEENKNAPLTAPNFCMLLRKHIGNGRILSITQPGLERIIDIRIEHRDELGDLVQRQLIIEIMGKHSNIIFCDDNDQIIDSIKHVNAQMSSVREVLPGRPYFIPNTMGKLDPLSVTEEAFTEALTGKPMKLGKAIYTSLTGISPVIAEELCCQSGADSSIPARDCPPDTLTRLYRQFSDEMDAVKHRDFSPTLYEQNQGPVDFSCRPISHYSDCQAVPYDSVSRLLGDYYHTKNTLTRTRQKSADLRHIVQTALERNVKKYDLQRKQLADTKDRDTYRVYGELINTYGYDLTPKAEALTCENYYTNETVTIPLDPQKTPQENAQKYFARYNKQKRTYEALSPRIKETAAETQYLESVQSALDMAENEADLSQIKEELTRGGYLRKKTAKKKARPEMGRPLHYLSRDGYDIYVGKNNLQNDELTFSFAEGDDWWFHAKNMPGSHVIVRAKGAELPDATFEDAARLAAYYSKGKGSDKVEVDYVQKKQVKKPNGAKPGYVIYHTNYSMVIDPDISGISPASSRPDHQ